MYQQYEESDLFNAFRNMQDRGIMIVFGACCREDPEYGTYTTYAASFVITETQIESREDINLSDYDIKRYVNSYAIKMLDKWSSSVKEDSILVLRNLPKFCLVDDFDTGNKILYFYIRHANAECTFPAKVEGNCTVRINQDEL